MLALFAENDLFIFRTQSNGHRSQKLDHEVDRPEEAFRDKQSMRNKLYEQNNPRKKKTVQLSLKTYHSQFEKQYNDEVQHHRFNSSAGNFCRLY